ncbi:MAG: flagellar hook-length control protein FliK [Rickettsiales bacterium]
MTTIDVISQKTNPSTATVSGTGLSGDLNTFLKLFTVQLKNQDPTDPHANFAYLRSEVMDQVKVGVTQAVRDGVDRITIQLNPQDLGRVEVKMDIAADGMSQISFLVDKADTFDLLQRDARSLERMLHDAGVRADAGSMEFNLRQESQNKEPWGEAANRNDGESMTTETSTLSATFNPGDLPTQMYVHLVSDRLDITA